ncbi:MAG: histidine kinase [Deltaproteobacteria bacterium]|nr:histidine kinase [Deltaproteobacteria bacterium]
MKLKKKNVLPQKHRGLLVMTLFQVIYWTAATVWFVIAICLCPHYPWSSKGMAVYLPIWILTGLVLSSVLCLPGKRLKVISLHPLLQFAAQISGILLLATAHYGVCMVVTRHAIDGVLDDITEFNIWIAITITSTLWLNFAMAIGHLMRADGDTRKKIGMQMGWWVVFTVAFACGAIFDPENEKPEMGMLIWVPIWFNTGFFLSSHLLLWTRHLQVFAWTPVKQFVAMSIGFALLSPSLFWLHIWWTRYAFHAGPDTRKNYGVGFFVIFVTLLWTASVAAVGYLQRSNRAQKDALKSAADKANLELRFVRQQVNSHLVFNALNSIMAAIEENSQRASAMVMDLSHLLRQSLETLPQMGTLGEEVERLKLYLRIEKSRFEDNIRFEVNVCENLFGLPCLSMVMQPLVENAIKYGYTADGSPLYVNVGAHWCDNRLRIEVINPGMLKGDNKRNTSLKGNGIGLQIVRRRLTMEYGDAAELNIRQLQAGEDAEVCATLFFPAALPKSPQKKIERGHT